MNAPLLITDFSHAYADQGFREALVGEGYRFDWLDCTALGGTRCYCDSEAFDSLSRLLAPYLGVPGIHWIDSGDYHYLSLLFAGASPKPFTLVLLDNHPDDQAPEFPGVLSCGSWVRALRDTCPRLRGVVSIGPDGARPALEEPLGAVYLSIDKDILNPAYARTDWDQGAFTLPEVEAIVTSVFRSSDEVLGVDVCGELSADHGARPEDGRINLETNLSLLRLLTRLYEL